MSQQTVRPRASLYEIKNLLRPPLLWGHSPPPTSNSPTRLSVQSSWLRLLPNLLHFVFLDGFSSRCSARSPAVRQPGVVPQQRVALDKVSPSSSVIDATAFNCFPVSTPSYVMWVFLVTHSFRCVDLWWHIDHRAFIFRTGWKRDTPPPPPFTLPYKELFSQQLRYSNRLEPFFSSMLRGHHH